MLRNLRENIPSLFKKLGLVFSKKDIAQLNKYLKKRERFFIITRKKVFLKIRLQKNKDVIRDFKKEVEIYRFFKKNIQSKKTKILFPKLISFGKYKNLQWYLKEYQEGKLAGQMDKDFGLKNEFLKNTSPKDLAKGIINYQSFPFRKIKKLNLYHQGGWWYWQDFNFYQKTFLKKFLSSKLNNGLLDKEDLDAIKKIFRKEKKLLDKEAKCLCHGDLYPNNILLVHSKKTLILDWGRASFNNPCFDAAFIYLNSWRNKKWQKDFLRSYLEKQTNKEKFKKLFQISLISISIRLSCRCYQYLEDKKVDKKIKKIAELAFKNYIKNLKI